MKKEDIPQDVGALTPVTKELTYAVDESGKYTTELSNGWEIKAKALDVAWEDVEKRIADAKQKVTNKEASSLLYFIELKLMDIGIVAAYTRFWKWQVKRHLKPKVFNKLSDKKLQRYTTLFETSIEKLKNPFG